MKLFGTDGIRGEVNTWLTPTLAFKVGNAIGRVYEGDEVLVAKDTRNSGDMIEAALSAGLASAGKNVRLCGVIPTPALALLTNRLKTMGIMISASHNPPEFNGIKVIKNGFKLPDEEERRIEKTVEDESYVDYRRIGRIKPFESAREIYINEILKMFQDLNLSGFEIVIDAANGASYRTSPVVFKELGAKVKVLSDKPDGFNINKDCGSTNISYLIENKPKGAIGVSHDGDADRCIMVDETGEEVHGDKIIGIMALNMLKNGRLRKPKVVGTILSNLGLEEFLNSHGIKLIRAKVGDRYVLDNMIKEGSILGGERSGHIIFLDRSTTGDGLITALEVLSVLYTTGKSLNFFQKMIPDYPQVMLNVKVNDKGVAKHPKVLSVINELNSYGVRIVIRPSGTEPVVRVMVEGKDKKLIEEIAQKIAKVVEEVDAKRSA